MLSIAASYVRRESLFAIGKNKPIVRRLHNLFNQQVLQLASRPKELVQMGFKERWPECWQLQLSEALLFANERGYCAEEWYKHSVTHCGTTAGALHRTAANHLFKTNAPPLVKSERLPIPTVEFMQDELSKNGLNLYRFVVGKGAFGHIFTVIKFQGKDDPLFFLYQIYFHEYSLAEFMRSSSFRPYTLKQMKGSVLTPLVEMEKNKKRWSTKNYQDYERITGASMASHEKIARNFPGEACVTWEYS